jgi:hypothetical protein
MSRRSRKQLILEDKEFERNEREEGYRRLERELHRAWREQGTNTDAASTEVADGQSEL